MSKKDQAAVEDQVVVDDQVVETPEEAPAKEKKPKGKVHFFDPKEVVANDDLNGRWKPHDEESIIEMCEAFESAGGRQLQPCIVRIKQGVPILVAGYRRREGALEYNRRHPDKPMLLQCIVHNGNDQEAFIANLIENHDRKDTSPMDDAINHRKLREQYGYTDHAIAKLYGVSQPYVNQLKKLMLLKEDYKDDVHTGKMALSTALNIADLGEEEQTKIVEEARNEKGRVEGGRVRRAVKRLTLTENEEAEDEPVMAASSEAGAVSAPSEEKPQEEEKPAEEGKKSGKKSRRRIAATAQDLKNLFETAREQFAESLIGDFFELLQKFAVGDMTDERFLKRMKALERKLPKEEVK